MIEIKRSVKQISCTERVRAPNTKKRTSAHYTTW